MSSEEREMVRALEQRAAVNAETIKELMGQVEELQAVNARLKAQIKALSKEGE